MKVLKGKPLIALLGAAVVLLLSGCKTAGPEGVSFRIQVDDGTKLSRTNSGLCNASVPSELAARMNDDREFTARYAIEVEEMTTDHSACHYSGHEDVPRVEVDWLVRLIDLETEEKIAEQEFEGTMPYANGCPEMITANQKAFYGCPENVALDNWLAGVLEGRPGLP